MFSTYGPFETFQKLRSYLKSTDYINAIPSFVSEWEIGLIFFYTFIKYW
jgi:hypothetical protein